MFKKKSKEKLDFPLFGPSSSPDSHNNLGWETDIAQNLLRTKSESDLANTEFNPHRLETYLLDSIRGNVQQAPETYTPASDHTQTVPVPVNPPTPMAARFAPLRLPAALHDLPQNYSQRISLFDGEGDITEKQHVAKFEYFIDLEEVTILMSKCGYFPKVCLERRKSGLRTFHKGLL